MSSVTIPIPPGKVIHWEREFDGDGRVLLHLQLMRFLTPGEAKARTYNRKDAA